MTQSQCCSNENNYSDVDVPHASVWYEFLGGLFLMLEPMIWKGNVTTRSDVLNSEHLFDGVGIQEKE